MITIKPTIEITLPSRNFHETGQISKNLQLVKISCIIALYYLWSSFTVTILNFLYSCHLVKITCYIMVMILNFAIFISLAELIDQFPSAKTYK